VKDKQVDRIRNLFRRQLSVPLSDIDSTLQDYKFWEEQKGTVIGNDTDQLTGLPSNVISGYKRALQMYNARAGYEEKVAGGKHADAELFQNYLVIILLCSELLGVLLISGLEFPIILFLSYFSFVFSRAYDCCLAQEGKLFYQFDGILIFVFLSAFKSRKIYQSHPLQNTKVYLFLD
jgi:hypothetical protein